MTALTGFRVLSFDCYGTLIDWEAGILASLAPWLRQTGIAPGDDQVLEAFGRHESAVEAASPHLSYPQILAATLQRMAEEWGVACRDEDAARFGGSVGDWPPFPDTVEALRYLERYYRLVILSNVDQASFRRTAARLGIGFEAVFMAEDIGSYKPDRRNFAYLIDQMGRRGFAKGEILHTAQSVFHDLVPASEMGLATCWIDRRQGRAGTGATPRAAAPRVDFRFASLAEVARHHRGLPQTEVPGPSGQLTSQ
jgi:2-haloalkanoic acid dehalogenase type II